MGLFSSIIKGITGFLGDIIGFLIGVDFDDFDDQAQGALVNKQSNIDPIPVVYGKRKVGGVRVFVSTGGGKKNKYLYMAVVLSEGEIQAIDQIYINDKLHTHSDYSGLIQVDKKLGTDGQLASTVLKGSGGDTPDDTWGNNHRLRGVAYLGIRIKYDADVFGGIPEIQCVIRGRKVYDPRTSTTAYSNNPALCLRDYLTNTRYGKGLPTSAIDDTAFGAAATYYDTTVVPYSASPSPSAIKQFECNARLDTGRTVFDNVKEMLQGMRGLLPYTDGKYALLVDKVETHSFELTPDNILSDITVTDAGKGKRFNRVIAKFPNPAANWQMDSVTYPVKSTAADSDFVTFLSEDNDEELVREVNLNTITNLYQARDMARVICEASRRNSRAVTLTATSEAMDVAVGDVIRLEHPSMGWTGAARQLMRVVSTRISDQGEVDLQLVEYNDVYTWSELAEENDNPDTSLPDPFDVTEPTGLSVTENSGLGPDGTVQPKVSLSWTEADDAFVDEYEVQWKLSTASDYSNFVKVTDVQADLFGLEVGSEYTFRVRSINTLGVRSEFTSATITLQGDTTAPGAVTLGSITGGVRQIIAEWTNPTDDDYAFTEVHVATSNTTPGVSASPTAKVAGEEYVYQQPSGTDGAVTRYFFLRAVDFSGNKGAYTGISNNSGTSVLVDNSDIADDAVDSDQIADGAVDTDQIASDAVTNNELADSSVSLASIIAGTASVINPVSQTGNLNRWGGFDSAGNPETSIPAGVTVEYDTTEKALELRGDGNLAIRSESFVIDHNSIYKVSLRAKKDANTGLYYIGLYQSTSAVTSQTSDGGNLQTSVAFTRYAGSNRASDTNANAYFHNAISTTYEDFVFYLMGANVDIDEVPQASITTGHPYLQVSSTCDHVGLRLLNWSNGSKTRSAFFKDLSVVEMTATTIIAENISTTNLAAINSDLGDIDAGSLDIGSGKFTVSAAGAMTATDAVISGQLDASKITVGSGANTAAMSSSGDVRFWAGSENPTNTTPFVVEKSGEVFARNLVLTDDDGNEYFNAADGFTDLAFTQVVSTIEGAKITTYSEALTSNSDEIQIEFEQASNVTFRGKLNANFIGTATSSSQSTAETNARAAIPDNFTITLKYHTSSGFTSSQGTQIASQTYTKVASGVTPTSTQYALSTSSTLDVELNEYSATATVIKNDAGAPTTSGFVILASTVSSLATGTYYVKAFISSSDSDFSSTLPNQSRTVEIQDNTDGGGFTIDGGASQSVGAADITSVAIAANNGITGAATQSSGAASFTLGLGAITPTSVTTTGDITVGGNLTVNGTTTTLDTTNLQIEDNNIVLNYASGDSSAAAPGAGITIQDAVDASNDATLLWDQANSQWDFSHDVTAPNLNVSNWDTAYGWGDHAGAGYLTSETSHADVVVDGDFTAAGLMKRGSSAGSYSVITDNSTNWNTAYTRVSSTRIGLSAHSLVSFEAVGDYSKVAGYQTMMRGTQTNASVVGTPKAAQYWLYNVMAKRDTGGGTAALLMNYTGNDFYYGFTTVNTAAPTWRRVWDDNNFSQSDVNNWNTAYGWGDHSTQGYLTSADLSGYLTAEADTLATVTGRGATTTNDIQVGHLGVDGASNSSYPLYVHGHIAQASGSIYSFGDFIMGNGGLKKGSTTVIDSARRISTADGAADAPAYRFSSDSNTGIFRSGADQIGLSTGGLTRALIDSAGLDIRSGGLRLRGGSRSDAAEGTYLNFTQVGASTDTTNWKKVADVTIGTGLYKALALHIRVKSQYGNFGNTTRVTFGEFMAAFYRSSNVQDNINNASLVGYSMESHELRIIKTATGVYELQIRQKVSYRDAIVEMQVLSTNGGVITVPTTTANGSTTGTVYSEVQPESTSNTQTHTFGDVQLGTIKTQNGAASAPAYTFGNDSDIGMFRAATNGLGFSTAAIERLRIDSSGRALFNATSTAFNDKIYVNGDGYATGGWRTGTGATFVGEMTNISGKLSIQTAANRDIQLGDTANASILYVDTSAQRVGINTTSPTATLDVNGAQNLSGNLTFVGSTRKIIMTDGTTSSQPSIAIGEQNLYGYRQRWDSASSVQFEGWWSTSTTGATNRDFGSLNVNTKQLTHKGNFTVEDSGTANSPAIAIDLSNSSTFIHASESFAGTMTAGQTVIDVYGKVGSTKNSGYVGYYWSSAGSNNNFVSIGHWGNDHLLRIYGGGNVSIQSGALLIQGTTTAYKSGNYMIYCDGGGAAALYAGNTSDNRNYYQSAHHRFRDDAGTTNFGEISSAGWHIGATTTPSSKLQVTGDAYVTTRMGVGTTPNTSYDLQVDEHININSGHLYLDGTVRINENGNATLGTISSGAITSSADLTLSGNDTELRFTGGNNRILFSGYRALEGSTNGGILQVGEGYATVQSYGHLNLTSGHAYQVNGTTVIDASRRIQNASIDAYIGITESSVRGNGLNPTELMHYAPADANVLQDTKNFNVLAFKHPTLYKKASGSWSSLGVNKDVTNGKAAHAWGANIINRTGDEYIFYFGNALGYSFMSGFTIMHSTNGNSMTIYIETAPSGTSATAAPASGGWVTEVNSGSVSSWPGSTTIKKNVNVGGAYRPLFRVRIVPNFTHASNHISLGQIIAKAGYGTVTRLFDWNGDRNVTFSADVAVTGATTSGGITSTGVGQFNQDIRSAGMIRATGWYNDAASTDYLGSAIEIGTSGSNPHILAYNRSNSTYQQMIFGANTFKFNTATTFNIATADFQIGGTTVIDTGRNARFARLNVASNTTSAEVDLLVRDRFYSPDDSDRILNWYNSTGGTELHQDKHGIVFSDEDTTTSQPGRVGLALANNSTTNNVWSPAITFGGLSSTGNYQAAGAAIATQLPNANDTNFRAGDLHFFTSGTANADRGLKSQLVVTRDGNVDIKNGDLRIGTTTVIDSSRNLTNIHDITFNGVVRSTNNANVDGPNFNVSTTNKTTSEYAYRVDRSGTVKGGITIDGVFKSDTGLDLTGAGSAYIKLNNSGFITFYGNGSADHGIGSRNTLGNAADDIRINSYGAFYVNLDSNNNNTSGADFLIGRHGSGTGTMSTLFTISGETGQLKAADGTGTAPAYSFNSDPNTGMFSGGADVLKFTTGGTNGLTINATDIVMLRDHVSVKDKLRHYGDTDTYIRFTTDRIRMVAGNVTFMDATEGATDYLRFPHRGVTIGSNTSPQACLTIEQNSTVTPASGGGTDNSTFLRLDNSNTTASASSIIVFNADDAGGNTRHGAAIQFKKSSNWGSGSGSYPGELYFWTRPSSGNQAAAQKLDKDGNAIFKGNVTAYGSLSDRRLKQNIENITDAVEKVQDLNGVTFEYKKDGKRATGLIAQDLEQVLPEAVYTSSDIETGEEHKAIHYGNVVGLLVEAIKEQQDQIDQLKEVIKEMSNGYYKND